MRRIQLAALGCGLITVLSFQNCAPNKTKFDLASKIPIAASTAGEGSTNTLPATNPGTAGTEPDLPPPVVYKSCKLENGTEVPNLWYSWGLQNSAADPTKCDLFEVRQCFDGTLHPSSGNFNHPSCLAAGLPYTVQTNSCLLDGVDISHGQIIMTFRNQLENGNCIGAVRRCVNGNLTGDNTYNNITCGNTAYRPASGANYDCKFNGSIIPDGSSQIAFKERSPAGACEFEPRVCLQGRLSGTHAFPSCAPKSF